MKTRQIRLRGDVRVWRLQEPTVPEQVEDDQLRLRLQALLDNKLAEMETLLNALLDAPLQLDAESRALNALLEKTAREAGMLPTSEEPPPGAASSWA